MLDFLNREFVDKINDMLMTASTTVAEVYYDYVHDNADIDIQKKSDASPVTKADKLLHDIICEKLAVLTPNIFCLSEESENEQTDRKAISSLWLLDPVDGTRAFIGKTGEFTINLALIHQKKVVASWIVVPMQAELYCCIRKQYLQAINLKSDKATNQGDIEGDTVYGMSFLHNIPNKFTSILLPNFSNTQLNHVLSPLKIVSSPLTQKLASRTKAEITLGLSRSAEMRDYEGFIYELTTRYDCDVEIVQASSAYKFVQMLRDEIDVYVRAYPTCEWDTASGQGLIESIGGQLVNFRGNEFLYNTRNTLKNGGFVCFKHHEDRQYVLPACNQIVEEK